MEGGFARLLDSGLTGLAFNEQLAIPSKRAVFIERYACSDRLPDNAPYAVDARSRTGDAASTSAARAAGMSHLTEQHRCPPGVIAFALPDDLDDLRITRWAAL